MRKQSYDEKQRCLFLLVLFADFEFISHFYQMIANATLFSWVRENFFIIIINSAIFGHFPGLRRKNKY